ncbi:hypothetical protein RDWZM_008153, partial [Blomia tropicalis]
RKFYISPSFFFAFLALFIDTRSRLVELQSTVDWFTLTNLRSLVCSTPTFFFSSYSFTNIFNNEYTNLLPVPCIVPYYVLRTIITMKTLSLSGVRACVANQIKSYD